MKVTLKDIANEVGVTPSVVSRVLNGKAEENRIKKETVDVIKKKAKEMNYTPNQLAVSLRLKKSKIIGLITPDIANPFFSSLTKKIQSDISLAGYSLMIFDSNEDTEIEKKAIDVLISKGVDGLIVIPVGQESEHIKKVSDENFPMVLLFRIFEDLKINSVTVDNYSVTYEIVANLLKNGNKRIGMIQGSFSISSSRERLRGYMDALRVNGADYKSEYVISTDFTYAAGYIGTKKLLVLPEPPTAVITTSEMITLGSFQAVAEKNLRIPDDFVLVPFDSLNYSKSLVAPFDSAFIPKDKLADVAVEMILENIRNKGKGERKKVVLSCSFIKYNERKERLQAIGN
jgi:LacI family transcriptional regulator